MGQHFLVDCMSNSFPDPVSNGQNLKAQEKIRACDQGMWILQSDPTHDPWELILVELKRQLDNFGGGQAV